MKVKMKMKTKVKTKVTMNYRIKNSINGDWGINNLNILDFIIKNYNNLEKFEINAIL